MGAVAVGRYLQQLRDHARLSRAEVAAQVRELTGTATNDVQIFRIERGVLDTKGTVLMALAQVVGGNLAQIQQLLLDANATTAPRRTQVRRGSSRIAAAVPTT